MIILGHHYVTILLAKMLIWAPFSQPMCTFYFYINPWIINPNYPYNGASPDAIVECKCWEIRCLKIKCPCSHRGDSIPQPLKIFKNCQKKYLHKNNESKVQLTSNHSNYYHI